MASAWLKKYLQASFRGADFFIKGHKYQGGRRLVSHVFPEREDIEYEDLGGKPREGTLTAYVLADDYFPQRDELIKALNKKGPGTLVHPYLGILEVHCPSFSEGEVTEEGRMARFDISYKQKARDQLAVTDDTVTQVYEAKTNLLDTVTAWLEETYTLVQQQVKAIEDVNSTLDAGLDAVDNLKKIANTQAEFKRAVDNTRGKLIELSLSATIIAQSFGLLTTYGTDRPQGIVFSASPENAEEQYAELLALTNFADVQVTDTPPEISQVQGYPAYQIQQMLVYQAVAGMSGLLTVIPFGSAEDAEEKQSSFFTVIDALLVVDGITDDLYASLRNIKATVHADLSQRIVNLPRLVDFQLPETNNTLFVSNEIHGSIAQEQDIIDRNKISHPGFVSSATILQVKIDD